MIWDSKLQTFPRGKMWAWTCCPFWTLLSLETIPSQTCYSSAALNFFFFNTLPSLQYPKWENNRFVLNSSFFLLPLHPILQWVPVILNLLNPPLLFKLLASQPDRHPQAPLHGRETLAAHNCDSFSSWAHTQNGHISQLPLQLSWEPQNAGDRDGMSLPGLILKPILQGHGSHGLRMVASWMEGAGILESQYGRLPAKYLLGL